MDEREQRGIVIAATCRLKQKGKAWLVPSSNGTNAYTVVPDATEPHCTCKDHQLTGKPCKHIHAVGITIKREQNDDGTFTETRTITLTEKRTTYKQDWRAYNQAQTNEKALFQTLLHALCRGLPDRAKTRGTQYLPTADAVFSAVFKVYTTISARRFMTDLRGANENGYISKCPCHNSVLGVFENEEMFPILKLLVERAALPLKSLETTFACDSSGFSACRYDKWVDHKYGPAMRKIKKAWCKAHVMTGTKTNVVTAIEILGPNANDGVQLPTLLATTAQNFNVKEVPADMAYSFHNNLEVIVAAGATPLIPFKSNASDVFGGLWAKCFHYFQLNREAFLSRYHQRSNVESTFSMVKRKFGDSLRSKTDVAMKNETLAKFICHNICCVIQEMYESGVDVACWAELRVAQQVAAG